MSGEQSDSTRGPHRFDVGILMRDRVRLSADIHFPVHGPDGGPYPVVLQRTPYSKQNALYAEPATFLAAHGYVCVVQDVRGRYDSDGEWRPFANERDDGVDTVEWLVDQPWCDGRVGTMGGSYSAFTQWETARARPPGLATMISTAPAAAWHRELPAVNGMVSLWALGWFNFVGGRTVQDGRTVDWPTVWRHLPLRTIDEPLGRALPQWREWLDHLQPGPYWPQLSEDDFAAIELPVLHITGWHDGDRPGATYCWQGMRACSPARDEQQLLIGPWDHAGTRHPSRELGGIDFGADALLDMNRVYLSWFDRWLRGQSSADEPRCRVFVTGANRWWSGHEWPPAGTTVRTLFLRSAGKANSLSGDGTLSLDGPGEEAPDSYAYDPLDPVLSVLDENLYQSEVATPLDQRRIERRDDVLVYTGPVLTETLSVGGEPRLRLFACSDGPDTDWVVTLTDVAASGRSQALARGYLRASYSEEPAGGQWLTPGRVQEFWIQLGEIAHLFHPGHRLRLTITSSWFPTYARNLNTAEVIADAVTARVAVNTVWHDPPRPSRLELPVLSTNW